MKAINLNSLVASGEAEAALFISNRKLGVFHIISLVLVASGNIFAVILILILRCCAT